MRIDMREMGEALAGVGFLGLWACWFWWATKLLVRWLPSTPYDPSWRRAFNALVIYIVAIFGFQIALALAFLRW